MSRVYNFSAGPAVLPEEVLKKAADEMLEYGSSGMSVMEMSHRSKDYDDIINETESALRRLMMIPENYHVLFLQGGASLQFSMVPMNIMTGSRKCDIINTGIWTQKAIKEAEKFGSVNIAASSEDRTFAYIPPADMLKFSDDADYVHICYNNTIYGTKYREIPFSGKVPIVADMSSCILSENYNVNDFGIIFAGAQKNIGPAGLTIVIIRDDLLRRIPAGLPSMLDFKVQAESRSLFNTPPTYAIYIAGLVFKWIEDQGGIDEMEKRNYNKAGLLYDFIDNSGLFRGNVDRDFRSIMNVTFTTGIQELDNEFAEAASREGLVNLRGHKTSGGMRASIYNAMPIQGIGRLIEFMKEFEKNHS